MKKKIWIFGGSFCCGYQNGGGKRDWIAQLDADVTVWACAPQSPESQYLSLQHAFECNSLQNRFQHKPDLIIYDYPPTNRVKVPTDLPDSEQNILNYWHYANSRNGHKFECGCDVIPDQFWAYWSLTLIDEWHNWNTTERFKTFIQETKQKLITAELPDYSSHKWTIDALDYIQQKDIPYVWFSANNCNHAEATEHLDNYLDIHTLGGTIPTQIYNSKTFNHLSIQQNTMWSDYFNRLII
jgi:hypothetical protein